MDEDGADEDAPPVDDDDEDEAPPPVQPTNKYSAPNSANRFIVTLAFFEAVACRPSNGEVATTAALAETTMKVPRPPTP
jgi:hypothetical protein